MNNDAQKYKATTPYMGSRAGYDFEMKQAKCLPIYQERHVARSDHTTSFYPALQNLQTSRYNQQQSNYLSKCHRQGTVPSKICSFNSTSSLNEDSSPLVNIKITSTFSLNPNILINPTDTEQNRLKFEFGAKRKLLSSFPVLWQPENQMKNAMANHNQSQPASFTMPDNINAKGGFQIPAIHFDANHRQQEYTHLETGQEISAEYPAKILNQKLPYHPYICHGRAGASRFLHQDCGIDPTKTELQPERNDLHEQISNHFPQKIENGLCRRNKNPNMKSPQTAPIRNKKCSGSVEKYQQDTGKSLSFVTIERTEQAQASDESIATDMMTRGMPSSLSTNSGVHHLPVVSSTHGVSNAQRRLVGYTGKMQLQKLYPENFPKLKLNNEIEEPQESANLLYSWDGTNTSTATVLLKDMDKVGQMKTLGKSVNTRRKFPSTQILFTPEPELFENVVKELGLENDEEPVVKIPNYFLDFSIECTQNNPLTLINSSSPLVLNETSQPDCCPIQKKQTPLEYTKLKGVVTKESPNAPRGGEPPKKRALSFLRKPSSQDSQVSQVFAGAAPVNDLPPQSSDRIPPGSKENDQQNGPLSTTALTKIYKRVGGAHPSIKPTEDFTRLLPPSPRELGCEYPTRQGFVVHSTDKDQQPQVKEKTPCFNGESEGENRVNSSNLPQRRFQTVQDNSVKDNTNMLSETESLKSISFKAEKSLNYLSNEHCSVNGSFDKRITSTCTKTSVGENVTAVEFYEGRKHQCEVCGRAFSRSNTLITHKRIHTGDRPFPCDLCGKAFRQLGNLTRHKLTHTAVKPHACPKCNKCFSRSSNLNTHLRTHSNYKPFLCDFCGKGFHQKVDMKIHRYMHTGEKPHKCGTCGRGFKQLTHLKYHTRTHSAERLYKCQHCGKGFNQKGNLQAHIYGHTGNRPYRCDICGKGFTLTSTLNTHKRIHAPDKPFKCEFCDKAFYQKNALKTHYISSHPYTDGMCLL